MNKKNIIKYILFFIVVFILQLLFNQFRYDTIYNFGMSSSIVKGEIPYKDINMIITPLYPFLMTIGLYIHNVFWVYLLEQSLILTLFYFFLEKVIKKSTIVILYVATLCYFDFIFPNYNSFIVFLLVILIYCEKNKKSDYIIGLLLAALIFTKQNIGIVIYIINIISTLSIKKNIKRTIPSIVGGIIFLIYLLINNALYSFIDLSILGLKSFANTNATSSIYIVLVIICLIYNIYFIYNNKKDKNVYYLIATYFFIIPICNRFHFIYFLISNICVTFLVKNPTIKIKLKYLFIFLMSINITYYSFVISDRANYLITNNTMSGFLINKKDMDIYKEVLQKFNSYNKARFFTENSMLLDLYNKNKISYYDIPNHGNFGKGSVKTIIKQIKQDKGTYYFIINDNNYGYQFAFEIVDFISSNYKKIDQVNIYEIYYIE